MSGFPTGVQQAQGPRRDRGGPGFTQFALNNACNANCGFCGFARETFPKDKWKFVDRDGGLEAIDILYRQGTRYLLFTGGERFRA